MCVFPHLSGHVFSDLPRMEHWKQLKNNCISFLKFKTGNLDGLDVSRLLFCKAKGSSKKFLQTFFKWHPCIQAFSNLLKIFKIFPFTNIFAFKTDPFQASIVLVYKVEKKRCLFCFKYRKYKYKSIPDNGFGCSGHFSINFFLKNGKP